MEKKLVIGLIAAALLATAANASQIEVRPPIKNDVIVENGSADCIPLVFAQASCR